MKLYPVCPDKTPTRLGEESAEHIDDSTGFIPFPLGEILAALLGQAMGPWAV